MALAIIVFLRTSAVSKEANPISLDEAGPKPVDNLSDSRDELKSFVGVHRPDYGLELEMFSCTVLVTSKADQEE
jgi:hypothetical protein